MNDALQPDLVSRTWSGEISAPERIPGSADVVIIGGGIIGVSTAWFLSKRGVDVVLCEKGHIAGEQSSRNWGWVRQQGRDTRELPLMIDSMRVWESLEEDIGESVGFRQGGCLFAASDEAQYQRFVDWLDIAREYELDTRVMDRDELAREVGAAQADWAGALFTASDGCAEPHLAAPAIARAAARNGAMLLTGCAVRGLETAGGRLSSVVTEHGPIRTGTALLAAGAWSSMFCRSIGVKLPQLRVRGTVVRTAPGPDILAGNLFSEQVGIRRRHDGGYSVAHGTVLDHAITPSTLRFGMVFLPALLTEIRSLRLSIGRDFIDELKTPLRWDLDGPSPFEAERVLSPAPNQKVVAGIRENLDRTFPVLADTPIAETWAGMVETTPDVVPVMGEVESLPGLFVATGFSGHGFGIGPGAGKAMAAILSGDDPGVDLRELRLSRFSDGSRIRPQSIM